MFSSNGPVAAQVGWAAQAAARRSMASLARAIVSAGPKNGAVGHRAVEEQSGDPGGVLAVDLLGQAGAVAVAAQHDLVEAERSAEVDEVGGALDGVVAVEIDTVGLETVPARRRRAGGGPPNGPRRVRSPGSPRRTRRRRVVVRCVRRRARRRRRWCGCHGRRVRCCRRPNRSTPGSPGPPGR